MPSIRTVTQFDFEPSRERCAFLFLEKIGFAADLLFYFLPESFFTAENRFS
jgi:hypothetical protein